MGAWKVLLQQYSDGLLVRLQAAVLGQPGQHSGLHRAASRHLERIGSFMLCHLQVRDSARHWAHCLAAVCTSSTCVGRHLKASDVDYHMVRSAPACIVKANSHDVVTHCSSRSIWRIAKGAQS